MRTACSESHVNLVTCAQPNTSKFESPTTMAISPTYLIRRWRCSTLLTFLFSSRVCSTSDKIHFHEFGHEKDFSCQRLIEAISSSTKTSPPGNFWGRAFLDFFQIFGRSYVNEVTCRLQLQAPAPSFTASHARRIFFVLHSHLHETSIPPVAPLQPCQLSH